MHKLEKNIIEEIKVIEEAIKTRTIPENIQELSKSKSNKVRALCGLIVTHKEMFYYGESKSAASSQTNNQTSSLEDEKSNNSSKNTTNGSVESILTNESASIDKYQGEKSQSEKNAKNNMNQPDYSPNSNSKKVIKNPSISTCTQSIKKKRALVHQVKVEDLAQDPCSDVRAQILKYIGNVSILKSFIGDSNANVKIAVLKALNKIKIGKKQQKKIITAISGYINNKDVTVRLLFSRYLRKLNLIGIPKLIAMFDKEDMGTFIFGAEDESVDVRKAILHSIYSLVYEMHEKIQKNKNKSFGVLEEKMKIGNYDSEKDRMQIDITKSQNYSAEENRVGIKTIDSDCTSKQDLLTNLEETKNIDSSCKVDKLDTDTDSKKQNISKVKKKKNRKSKKNKKVQNEPDSDITDKDIAIFPNLIDVLFDYLSDILNDSSETIRLIAAKLLSKISNDFLIEKETFKVISVLLNIKENELAPYILDTVENLLYFDTGIGINLSRYLTVEQLIYSFKKIVIKNVFLYEREFKLNGQIYDPSKYKNEDRELLILLNSEAYKTIQEQYPVVQSN